MQSSCCMAHEHHERALRQPDARARKTVLPSFVDPQLATLVEAAPDGDEWLHELKLDGYRILARIDRGQVRLLTRRGHDWSSRMPSVARLLRRCRCRVR